MKHQRIGVLLLRTSCTGSAVVTNGTFCSLPPDTTESTGVSCFGIFTKYFFNETVEKCEEYVYGGCGATLNNFDTKEECDKAAETFCLEDENDSTEAVQDEDDKDATETLVVNDTTNSPSPEASTVAISNGTFCSLPPDETSDTGIACAAYIPKFYYNETSKKCEEYVYGGCGATLNNFDTKEECDKAAETYCLEDENDGKEEEKEEEEEATSLQGQDMIEQSAAASFSFELTTMRYFVALHVLLLYASVF